MAKSSRKIAESTRTKKVNYNRIKACLAIKRIKAKTLAEHLEVSEQTVSKWSTNYSQPSIPELYAIAQFLEVALVDLLEPLGYPLNARNSRNASLLSEPET